MWTATWIQKNMPSLSGKVIAVSGSTGGIGVELCKHLAALGAELILLDRNQEKSKALQKTLEAQFPEVKIRRIRMDLEEMASVKAAACELLKAPLDRLILNAGAYHIPRHKCDTGLDNVFQINFAAPYYLARELKPHLDARGGRLVAVGSIAHNYSQTDPEDVDFSSRAKHSLAYGNAKRFLMYSLYGLYGKQGGLAVAHPGITFTNITAHYPKVIFAIIKHPMKVIFMKPRRACLSILQGLTQDCGRNEWIGPRWFDVWGLPKKRVLKTCGEKEADWICKTAEEVYRGMGTP
ncbi:MAG: SDR family NAD(P)-dependent oxidoreductase [Clostridia bacterium]|nr:SDR family NAD(P)-dependent oxidoreductase [Clostridia bacterium]